MTKRLLTTEAGAYRKVQKRPEYILKAHEAYEEAYKRSIDLQHARARAMADYNRVAQELRIATNDALQDLKDRASIRVAGTIEGSGIGTESLLKESHKAHAEGDIVRDVSATVLGHIIDGVDRRHRDMLANHAATPDTFVCHETGEPIAVVYERKLAQKREKLAQLDIEFKNAEMRRSEAWVLLCRAKGCTR